MAWRGITEAPGEVTGGLSLSGWYLERPPRRRRVRAALRDMRDRWTWVRPALEIAAAMALVMPLRRSARYTLWRLR